MTRENNDETIDRSYTLFALTALIAQDTLKTASVRVALDRPQAILAGYSTLPAKLQAKFTTQ
jgi:hypothetical protein